MKLSVVVPVYGVERYLEGCVDSILKQSFADFELILVDDRSPDRCGEICDDFAARDSRVRVVHRRENGGLSAARNTGIETAIGEYITFVDSDDFIGEDTLSANMAVIEKDPSVDILEYPVFVDYGLKKAREYYPERIGGSCGSAFGDWVAAKGYYHCYACNKIFRKSLWESVRFPVGRYYEDVFTIPSIVEKSRKIAASRNGMYYYCNRKGSISTSPNPKARFDFISAELELFDKLKDSKYFTKTDADAFYLTICNWQADYLRLGGEYMLPDYDIKVSDLLLSKQSVATKIKAVAYKLFGKSYCLMLAKFLDMSGR